MENQRITILLENLKNEINFKKLETAFLCTYKEVNIFKNKEVSIKVFDDGKKFKVALPLTKDVFLIDPESVQNEDGSNPSLFSKESYNRYFELIKRKKEPFLFISRKNIELFTPDHDINEILENDTINLIKQIIHELSIEVKKKC